MHSVFKFPFKLHLIFFISLSQKILDSQFIKYQGKVQFFFANLLICLSLQIGCSFLFQCIFFQFTGHCKRQSKRNVIFISHKTRKEDYQQLEMKPHVADSTMGGNFVQPSGFQIRAETSVADCLHQNYCNENSLFFRKNSFDEGIHCFIWSYQYMWQNCFRY